MPDDFTAADAEDLHGYIDNFGKLYKKTADFEQSIFGDFEI